MSHGRTLHAQALIDELRYGPELASMVDRGKGKVSQASAALPHFRPNKIVRTCLDE